MVIGLFTVLHVVVCVLLILVVLLQKGKGQDFASTFGGGGTQTAFGARSGATLLHRATTAAAIIFMVTSLTLTILMSRTGQNSVLGGEVAPVQSTAPDLPPLPDPLPLDDALAPADEAGDEGAVQETDPVEAGESEVEQEP